MNRKIHDASPSSSMTILIVLVIMKVKIQVATPLAITRALEKK